MRNAKPVTVENLKFLNSLGTRTDARSVAVAYWKIRHTRSTTKILAKSQRPVKMLSLSEQQASVKLRLLRKWLRIPGMS